MSTEAQERPTVHCMVYQAPTGLSRTYGVDTEPNPITGEYKLVRFVCDPATGAADPSMRCPVAAFRSGVDAADFLQWLDHVTQRTEEVAADAQEPAATADAATEQEGAVEREASATEGAAALGPPDPSIWGGYRFRTPFDPS